MPVAIRASGLRWQNTLYAIQWWIFAVFVIFFVAKVVRDDRRDRAAPPANVEGSR